MEEGDVVEGGDGDFGSGGGTFVEEVDFVGGGEGLAGFGEGVFGFFCVVAIVAGIVLVVLIVVITTVMLVEESHIALMDRSNWCESLSGGRSVCFVLFT